MTQAKAGELSKLIETHVRVLEANVIVPRQASGLHLGSQATINAMQYQFREGDWVRHRSFPEPVRVIGIGSTIAVQFPNGEMRAFEPDELERVSLAKVPRPKVPVNEHRQVHGRGSAKRFVSLATSIGLICLILVVLAMLMGL
jgi:hypothetical protein